METPYPFIRDSLSPRPGPPEDTGIPNGAELFGPESSVALVSPDGIAARPASADTPGQSYAYEAVTLGVLAIFCYLLHSYRSSLAEAFKVVTMQLSIEKAFAEQTLFFRQFLTLSSLWGILLVSGLAVRYGDLYGLYTLLPLTADTAVAAVAAAVALIVGYRCLIVRIVGLVTRNEAFLAEHRFMNRIFSAFAYTLLTPLFLVVALVPAEEVRAALIGVAAVSAILYLTYLTKSYRFFVKRDVSIMQWILYLCTVEFFPVSFFVLAVLRGR